MMPPSSFLAALPALLQGLFDSLSSPLRGELLEVDIGPSAEHESDAESDDAPAAGEDDCGDQAPDQGDQSAPGGGQENAHPDEQGRADGDEPHEGGPIHHDQGDAYRQSADQCFAEHIRAEDLVCEPALLRGGRRDERVDDRRHRTEEEGGEDPAEIALALDRGVGDQHEQRAERVLGRREKRLPCVL